MSWLHKQLHSHTFNSRCIFFCFIFSRVCSRLLWFHAHTHMDPEIDYSDSLLWCDEKWILWLFYSETKLRYCPTPKNNICNKSKSIARRESCVCLCVYVCDRHSVSFDFSGCAFGCVRSVNCHSIKWNIQIRLFLVCKWILVVDWGRRGRESGFEQNLWILCVIVVHCLSTRLRLTMGQECEATEWVSEWIERESASTYFIVESNSWWLGSVRFGRSIGWSVDWWHVTCWYLWMHSLHCLH